MKICAHCLWENDDSEMRCYHCFRPLTEHPTHAGKPSGNGFNLEAKQNLGKTTRAEQIVHTEVNEQAPGHFRKALIPIAVVIILLLIGVGIKYSFRAPSSNNDPRQAAEQFLAAICKEDKEAQTSLVTTNSKKYVPQADALLGAHTFIASRLGKQINYQLGEIAAESDTIKVYRYQLTADMSDVGMSGEKNFGDQELVLRLQEGKWRVDLVLTAGRYRVKMKRDGTLRQIQEPFQEPMPE